MHLARLPLGAGLRQKHDLSGHAGRGTGVDERRAAARLNYVVCKAERAQVSLTSLQQACDTEA